MLNVLFHVPYFSSRYILIISFKNQKVWVQNSALLDFMYFPSDQVIGKALVLDEIINYIQSLQRQVEVRISIANLWQ